MDTYIKEYDTYDKIIVYDFNVGSGGIGDCIKFFLYVLDLCMKYKIKLYYQSNNTLLEKYLKLKYPQMYINKDQVINPNLIYNISYISNLTPNVYNVINTWIFYKIFKYEDIDHILVRDVFVLDDAIISAANTVRVSENYIGMHLRLGDMFLETERHFIDCPDDKRSYDESRIIDCIERNCSEPIVFFCDNAEYKRRLSAKYDNVVINDCQIGHTALRNTTDRQVVDTLVEFYLLSRSCKIYIGSDSSFSIMAAKFGGVELVKLYD